MEDTEGTKGGHGDPGPPERMPPALEWWAENFALVRDISIRRYPVHAQSYDGLLRDPERVIRDTLGWLGRGDANAALATPKPERRHFERPPSDSVEPAVATVFDELYAVIDQRRELSNALLVKLNETNERLRPRLEDSTRRVMADVQRRRAARSPAPEGQERGRIERDPST